VFFDSLVSGNVVTEGGCNMKRYWQRVLLTSALVLIIGAPALLAQKYELNGYGGSYWAGSTNVGALKSGQAIFGGRAGIFLDPNFELEGNFGYLNHFEVKGIDPRSRGFLYELAGNYNFSAKEWPVVRQFTPFLVFGAGAINSKLRGADVFSFTTDGGPTVAARTVNMTDGDTFFTFSYGGGVKSIKLAGPIGLRLDIRGRTMPNYYHSTPTWLEVTGGVNFMWGER
jgi:hypothetical protein